MSRPKSTDKSAPDFEQYRSYLRVLAIAQLPQRVQPRFDASDLVQETLMDAHRDWPQFDGSSENELLAWLRKILVHNLLSALRYARQQKRDFRREIVDNVNHSSMCLEKFLAGDQTSPSQCVRRSERYERLFQVLSHLPENQRQAVVLKHLHGKSLTDVAEALGVSVSATGGLLRRGMSTLRKMMGEG
jgi:RNA polymerase sigma-70 factor (ECF subfamily)